MLDFGYPQTTDPDALKVLSEDSRDSKGKGGLDVNKISSQVTGQIGWRRQDISYVAVPVYNPSGAILTASVVPVI